MKTKLFPKRILSCFLMLMTVITLNFGYSQSVSAATTSNKLASLFSGWGSSSSNSSQSSNFNPFTFIHGFGSSRNTNSDSQSTTSNSQSTTTNSQSESTKNEHNPVVFIHGLGGASYNFMLIERYLMQNGWSQDELFAIDLPDKAGNNSINGQAIDRYINDVLQKTGKSKVDIVAHSMGGSNSLYYINQLKGITKVDKLVTLGGANKLATSTAPNGVSVTSIYSSSDAIVMNSLSELQGANNIQISGVGHVSLLSNDKVNSLILQALEK